MNGSFQTLDYATAAAVCLLGAVLAAWARRSSGGDDFLLAARREAWWAIGPSFALGALPVMIYATTPLAAYWSGARWMAASVLVWVALPVVFWCVVPLYTRLDLDSVHEYVELRFGPAARLVLAVLWCAWQIVVLAAVLVLPARLFALDRSATVALIVAAGVVAAVSASLGGMAGSLRAAGARLALLIGVSVALVLAMAQRLPGGLPDVWHTAERLGRAIVFDTAAPPSATWSVWAVVPYFALAPIALALTDQTTAQRFFAARSELDMKVGWLLGSGLVALVVPATSYVGMSLLALYQQRAQTEMSPYWVAELALDPATGRAFLPPETPIDARTIGQLVEKGWILDPRTRRPFENTEELVNPRGQVVIDLLGTRQPRLLGGERNLLRGHDELLTRFVARRVPTVLRGVVLAALVATAMAAVDAGLTALATVAVVDFHGRFGWAEQWLARRCGKTAEQLEPIDELRLIRPVMLGCGAVVVAMAIALSWVGPVAALALGAFNVIAGPALGFYSLGIVSRRATSGGAIVGLVAGMVAAAWVALARATPVLWPGEQPPGVFWPLLIGAAGSLAVGFAASWIVGRPATREQLAGLVLGVGRLGVLPPAGRDENGIIWLSGDELPDLPAVGAQSDGPWSEVPWPPSVQRPKHPEP